MLNSLRKRALPGTCQDESEADRRERSQYFKEFWPAIVGYMVTLVAVMFVVDDDVDTAWNYLILVPVIPVAMAAWAVYRSVRRVDEYGRMIQLNGMALGFGVAMIGLVAIGLLATIDIHHVAGPWIVFMLAMLTWGISSGMAFNRDR